MLARNSPTIEQNSPRFVSLLKPIKAGQSLTYADVAMHESLTAVKLRREMEQTLSPVASKIAAQ